MGTATPCRLGRVRRGRDDSRLSGCCGRHTAEPAGTAGLNLLAGWIAWGSVTQNSPHEAAAASDADLLAPIRRYSNARRPAAPSHPDLGGCAYCPRRPTDHAASRNRSRRPRAHAAAIYVLWAAGVPQASWWPLPGSSGRAGRLLAGERSRPARWVRRSTRRVDPNLAGERARATSTPPVVQRAASSGHRGGWQLRPLDRDAPGHTSAAVVIPTHSPSRLETLV
jgi:hypothetical protein